MRSQHATDTLWRQGWVEGGLATILALLVLLGRVDGREEMAYDGHRELLAPPDALPHLHDVPARRAVGGRNSGSGVCGERDKLAVKNWSKQTSTGAALAASSLRPSPLAAHAAAMVIKRSITSPSNVPSLTSHPTHPPAAFRSPLPPFVAAVRHTDCSSGSGHLRSSLATGIMWWTASVWSACSARICTRAITTKQYAKGNREKPKMRNLPSNTFRQCVET